MNRSINLASIVVQVVSNATTITHARDFGDNKVNEKSLFNSKPLSNTITQYLELTKLVSFIDYTDTLLLMLAL